MAPCCGGYAMQHHRQSKMNQQAIEKRSKDVVKPLERAAGVYRFQRMVLVSTYGRYEGGVGENVKRAQSSEDTKPAVLTGCGKNCSDHIICSVQQWLLL